MRVVTLPVGELSTNCYIVLDPESGKCIVIDPGAEGQRIAAKIREIGGNLHSIVLTHGHFDHTGAAGFLHIAAGVPVMVGAADARLLSDPGWMAPFIRHQGPRVTNATTIDHGDSVSFGRVSLKVLHTPGHSPGSISLYCPGHLFSGDLIFKEGVGRTDLPGGDAEQLLASLTTKVMILPPETCVYPGHGENTTVGHEQKHNPFL
ncbi:MAG: MBL fold metallo-hydrolase [Bacillota bacterium]